MAATLPPLVILCDSRAPRSPLGRFDIRTLANAPASQFEIKIAKFSHFANRRRRGYKRDSGTRGRCWLPVRLHSAFNQFVPARVSVCVCILECIYAMISVEFARSDKEYINPTRLSSTNTHGMSHMSEDSRAGAHSGASYICEWREFG